MSDSRRKDKIRLATPRRSKHVKVTSEEVSEAVELFLRKGGVIKDLNPKVDLGMADAHPARDKHSSNKDIFV